MIGIHHFFAIAAFLYSVIVVANTYNLADTWNIISTATKVSSIASITFNALLIIVFIFLYKSQAMNIEPMRENQIEKIKKEVFKNG